MAAKEQGVPGAVGASGGGVGMGRGKTGNPCQPRLWSGDLSALRWGKVERKPQLRGCPNEEMAAEKQGVWEGVGKLREIRRGQGDVKDTRTTWMGSGDLLALRLGKVETAPQVCGGPNEEMTAEEQGTFWSV